MRLPPPIVIFPLATALLAVVALALRSHHDAPAVAPLPPNAQALADLTQIDFLALRTPPKDRLRLVRGAAASVSDRGVWITDAAVVAKCHAPMLMATPLRGLPARVVGPPVEGLVVLTTSAGAPALPLGERRLDRSERAFTLGFPDALDLLLICVESGLSMETAFGRVAREIGESYPELAEELELTTAELAYLPDRRVALENLSARTGLAAVKAVATTLIQADRYGTPLTAALRTAAQENRDNRLALAEKKAASLPATLTVPMIVFFLPVLFVVILGPTVIQVMNR